MSIVNTLTPPQIEGEFSGYCQLVPGAKEAIRLSFGTPGSLKQPRLRRKRPLLTELSKSVDLSRVNTERKPREPLCLESGKCRFTDALQKSLDV